MSAIGSLAAGPLLTHRHLGEAVRIWVVSGRGAHLIIFVERKEDKCIAATIGLDETEQGYLLHFGFDHHALKLD